MNLSFKVDTVCSGRDLSRPCDIIDRRAFVISWIEAMFAGILQGLTEFLPVSSSGHLVIYTTLFGEEDQSNLTFTVFLHFATLLSVIIVYYKDLVMLIRELFSAIADIAKGRPKKDTPERRFLNMVIIGTIPIVVAGLLLKLSGKESILENVFLVGVMLIITAIFMFSADRLNKGKYNESNAPYKASLLVGVMQAIALLPGLSRSGSTIFGGLLGGFTKEFAVKFAFVLSIPAVLGAGLMEFADVIKTGQFYIEPVNMLVGFVAAAISGIIAISFIKILAKSNKFYMFGVYCLIASLFAFLVGFDVVGF